MTYRVLWIPKNTFLLSETEKKLAELSKRGARIVRGDFTPDWPSPLKAMTGRDGKGVHWYQRRDGDEDIFFIAQPNGISYFMYLKNGEFVKIVNPVDGSSKTPDEIVIRKGNGPDSEVPLVFAEYEPYEPWVTQREYLHWFTAPEKKGKLMLSLGEVHDWATVKVNGKVAARLWCEPYACDIAPFVRPGKNEIRVEVVTTLRNTLIHEASLAPSERTTWVLGVLEGGEPFVKAGLYGPVKLESVK